MTTYKDYSLIEVDYSEYEIKTTIITNWVKMLINRGWIKNTPNLIKNVIKTLDIDEVKEVVTVDKYILKFYLKKISAVKQDNIIEFIQTNSNKYIFIILLGSEISPVEPLYSRVESQILEYDNIEVFTNTFLMIDRIDNILVPQHILLNEEEGKKYINEYGGVKELTKILIKDPIAKYYNAKAGNIFKIIRPSNTSGEEIAIRICTG
jgi:DNA-directed RNA polymerase subunit H (RpoH/RPB5)